jgi:hypothetical protein
MPLYNTATTAAALGVTHKWLDNLLSHNNIRGNEPDTQGIARRLSADTIELLALTKELIDSLHLKVPAAIQTAVDLLNSPSGELAVAPELCLNLDVEEFRASVFERIARAVETAPAPRRGRPRKR